MSKLFIIGLLLAAPLGAQDLPSKPSPTVAVRVTCGTDLACQLDNRVGRRDKWWVSLPVPHRTADRSFWLSTSTSLLMTVADNENSLVALRRPGVHEIDPLYGSHPSRARYYAIDIPIAIGAAAFSYHYKRQDDALRAAGMPGHRFVKWWLPNLLNTGSHAAGVIWTVVKTGQ